MNKLQNIFKTRLPSINLFESLIIKSILSVFKRSITVYNEEILEKAVDPVLFIFNHNSYIETVLIASYLIFARGKNISFVIDWMFSFIPVIGWMFGFIDPVYVYNKPSTVGFLNSLFKPENKSGVYDECIKRIRENKSIAIFPEGKINRDSKKLRKARRGAARIILGTDIKVIPIGIDFPSSVNTKKKRVFGPVIFRIGNIMNFSDYYQLIRELKKTDLKEHDKKRYEITIESAVSRILMLELSGLSGKTYPYENEEPCEIQCINKILINERRGICLN